MAISSSLHARRRPLRAYGCSAIWDPDTVMRNMTLPDPIRTRQVVQTEVGVLDRAVAVLDAVEHGARTHAAVVRATGLSRTTSHRLLKSLEAHGMLGYVDGRGYELGPRLLKLAAMTMQEPNLRDVAHPALERLAAATGESAQLYVTSVDGRVCVDAVESSSELRTFVPIGEELPLWAGSAGKIFLASMPPEQAEAHIRRARALTSATPTADRLRRQLATVQRQGWAASAGERQAGVGSVSAPVHGPRGETIAAVSISGPTSRIRRADARRYAPAVVAAAAEIQRALGYQA
jgi:DNA-binding IclR family transcriptional regulator